MTIYNYPIGSSNQYPYWSRNRPIIVIILKSPSVVENRCREKRFLFYEGIEDSLYILRKYKSDIYKSFTDYYSRKTDWTIE